MKLDDLLTYITKETVRYMESPRETRKQQREVAKALREPWGTRWFGMLPMALRMTVPRRANRSEDRKPLDGE